MGKEVATRICLKLCLLTRGEVSLISPSHGALAGPGRATLAGGGTRRGATAGAGPAPAGPGVPDVSGLTALSPRPRLCLAQVSAGATRAGPRKPVEGLGAWSCADSGSQMPEVA